MKKMSMVKDFFINTAVAFAAAAVVSFLYSLIAHGHGSVDWGSAVRLGIILGIALTWTQHR